MALPGRRGRPGRAILRDRTTKLVENVAGQVMIHQNRKPEGRRLRWGAFTLCVALLLRPGHLMAGPGFVGFAIDGYSSCTFSDQVAYWDTVVWVQWVKGRK